IPMEFVTEQSADWQKLKDLWTDFPGKAGLGLWPLGLPPLEAVVALEAQVESEKIKIKVPRGLPDPTPYLPATNPPTYGKWLLGRKLFFDRTLLAVAPGQGTYCADCHNPAQNFCSTKKTTLSGRRNVPSLVNSIYNRRQFWDGRAGTLEEVLLRQLEDERPLTQEPSPEQSPGNLHVWPGLIGHLRGRHDYLYAFQRVFGTDPTADNVAKAVSTYLRTLLSGDSIYDQAEQNRQRRKGETMEAKDIEPALSSAAIEALPVKLTAKEAAQQMAPGYELFHGRAGCSSCHPAPLFTYDGFHNVGVGDSDSPQLFSPGKEPGRFAHVPYGLKDKYLIGAYRTPTLRNVVLTAPYMH